MSPTSVAIAAEATSTMPSKIDPVHGARRPIARHRCRAAWVPDGADAITVASSGERGPLRIPDPAKFSGALQEFPSRGSRQAIAGSRSHLESLSRLPINQALIDLWLGSIESSYEDSSLRAVGGSSSPGNRWGVRLPAGVEGASGDFAVADWRHADDDANAIRSFDRARANGCARGLVGVMGTGQKHLAGLGLGTGGGEERGQMPGISGMRLGAQPSVGAPWRGPDPAGANTRWAN